MQLAAAPWEPFGLTHEEWRDCERSAREMTLASGARVRTQQVAAEFARARSSEAERFRALLASHD